jgi:hypothetical protein
VNLVLRFLALSITILSLCNYARADCECLWEGSFSEVQDKADLIVSATVQSGKGNSLDFAINQVLRGEESKEAVRVWMKTGDYCRPEADLFPLNSQWVLALFKIREEVPGGFNPGTPNMSYGRVGDYLLSSCGGYWLSQSEGFVTGNLVNAPRWDHNPKMTPVLLDLISTFVEGKLSKEKLLEASREDPQLRELLLDTRALLRN